jgi:hypothetical protein
MRSLYLALLALVLGTASTAHAVPPRTLKPKTLFQRLGITRRYIEFKGGWANYELGKSGLMELANYYTVKELPGGRVLRTTTHLAKGGPSLNTSDGLRVIDDALHAQHTERPLVSLINSSPAEQFDSRMVTLYQDGVAREQTTTVHFTDGKTRITETADVGMSPTGPVPSMTSRTYDTRRRAVSSP